jgi:choline/glycine/proline betaine transport protein
MLFAAGMGMGLIFWGVAEPVKHYINPATANLESLEAIKEGMQYSFFHWGLHPWAIYIIFALGVAYFHFRQKLPLAPRSLFYPLLGDRIFGWIGHLIDIFCTVGTLLGVATSLGLGAMQINSGLSDLLELENSTSVQVWIIVVITAAAVTSTISGVGKGIKYLSLANVGLMLLFLAFVITTGPTLYIVELFTTTLGRYLQNIVSNSLWINLRPTVEWQSNWTIFTGAGGYPGVHLLGFL